MSSFKMPKFHICNSRARLIDPRRRSTCDIKTRTPKGGGDGAMLRLREVPSRPERESQQVMSWEARQAGTRPATQAEVWRTAKLTDSCSYFENRDHVHLRNQLSVMSGTVAAAVATYGDAQPPVLEINRIYSDLRQKLWSHMFKEEHGLYSSICNIEQNRVKPFCASGIVTGAIRAIRREHRNFAKTFRRIAELLCDYEIPVNAGNKYRNLVYGFRDLEAFKLQHMQKEDIVYSQALALENELMRK
jgi:iron-sulfur cluster repair protein YtfE (RIC family)